MSRWRLASGSRTSMEFEQAWTSLRQEAEHCSSFLDKDLEGELVAGAVAAGKGRVDGGTRRMVVQQREGLRHEVLTLALKRHMDRQARPVTVFQNFDKLSGSRARNWSLL